MTNVSSGRACASPIAWRVPFCVVVAISSAASCTKPSSPSPTTPLNVQVTNANDAASPQNATARAEESADAHVPAPDMRGAAFVRETTALRREASEARFVEGKNKKRQSNFITLLQRGEAVEVIDAAPPFLRIKLSDETTGWAKATGIRVGATLSAATTFQRLHCFLRPDLLAMEAAKQVEPGTILFVLREKDSFSEVDAGPLTTYWVLTDALERDAHDIEAAKLFGRARAVAQTDADKAKPLFDLLRTRFSSTRLVQRLLGEEHQDPSTPDAVAADANAAAPSPDGPAAPLANDKMPASEMESLDSPLAPPPDADAATPPGH